MLSFVGKYVGKPVSTVINKDSLSAHFVDACGESNGENQMEFNEKFKETLMSLASAGHRRHQYDKSDNVLSVSSCRLSSASAWNQGGLEEQERAICIISLSVFGV